MVSFHPTLVRPGPTLLARRLAVPASMDVTFDIRRRWLLPARVAMATLGGLAGGSGPPDKRMFW